MLPPNLTLIAVSGTYVEGTAFTPSKGTIKFQTDQICVGNGTIILPRSYYFPLDSNGSFSGVILATDDPNITPQNYSYHVYERLVGNKGRATFQISAPMAGGAIDMSTVVPLLDAGTGQVNTGTGISLADADVRYLKISAGNKPGGPAFLDSNTFLLDSQLPLPPVDLSVLFDNQIA
jgi:hypothetical protein